MYHVSAASVDVFIGPDFFPCCYFILGIFDMFVVCLGRCCKWLVTLELSSSAFR